ncbi:hypothetical protein HAT2_00149 [Candidatus Similichlamydia laticola]|uniref:Uncharacterized protein n=2 Tax=Candidatus Similichlamydia laticola TaxID=2170265 RepID=A0A369KAY5_9BACT|nr:hypothetical protein HAT2_00149 [Candidatus Similichlamydia laticola]
MRAIRAMGGRISKALMNSPSISFLIGKIRLLGSMKCMQAAVILFVLTIAYKLMSALYKLIPGKKKDTGLLERNGNPDSSENDTSKQDTAQ